MDHDVIIGLDKVNHIEKAQQDGFTVLPVADAVSIADVVMNLMPDEVQPKVYEENIKPNLK